ncbi:HNH endonuclease, partial [Pseudonocardia xishanensis]|uniref:HNH endonuclease n=1 Tax=Pseudonocardia xishanensis TaxID=630995 RepID=UPI003CD06D34
MDYLAFTARRRPTTRQLLVGAATSVSVAYGDYHADFASCAPMRPVAPELKKALKSNFALMDNGKPFAHIRNELMAANGARCPLCANGTVATLDHYLPRASFPEFSILATNLVPCCERCNRIKGEKLKRADGARFLHAYFDRLPDAELLVAEVDTTELVAVDFSVVHDKSVPIEEYLNLHYHFEALSPFQPGGERARRCTAWR